MVKASENPDWENGFENTEIDCLTLFCPSYKSHKAFCALTQRKTMKTVGENRIPNKVFCKQRVWGEKRGRGALVGGGLWWFAMVYGGLWWFVVVCGGWWWFVMVYGGLCWSVLVCGGDSFTGEFCCTSPDGSGWRSPNPHLGPGPAPSPGVPWPQLHFPRAPATAQLPCSRFYLTVWGETLILSKEKNTTASLIHKNKLVWLVLKLIKFK